LSLCCFFLEDSISPSPPPNPAMGVLRFDAVVVLVGVGAKARNGVPSSSVTSFCRIAEGVLLRESVVLSICSIVLLGSGSARMGEDGCVVMLSSAIVELPGLKPPFSVILLSAMTVALNRAELDVGVKVI